MGMAGVITSLLLVGCNPQTMGGDQKNDAAMEPKDIYVNNCSSCHGGNLQGSLGPSLQKIGSKLTKEEIADIIKNGKGDMPGQSQISDQAREKLAAWLAEKK